MERTRSENTINKISPEKFALFVSGKLSVDLPQIVFDNIKTDLATYNTITDTLWVNDSVPSFKILFGIAHELRHKWQLINDPDRFFSNYQTLTELKNDTERYNIQIAEIDANAYARLIMGVIFNVTISGDLPETVNKLIEDHTHIIIEELLSSFDDSLNEEV